MIPITAISLISKKDSNPFFFIDSPPKPMNSTSGSSLLMDSIKGAPSSSPDFSPATIAIFLGCLDILMFGDINEKFHGLNSL